MIGIIYQIPVTLEVAFFIFSNSQPNTKKQLLL